MKQSRARLAGALVVGVLAALPSSAAAQKIEGQYIVVLKSGASGTAADQAKRKARDRGGRVQREYAGVIRGFSAKLNQKALDEVRKDPAVAFVEQDQIVTLSDTQNNATWGLDRIDQRSAALDGSYSYPAPSSTQVTAYIIDTGLRFSHADFGGRADSGYDAIDGGTADDCNGHGTHVGGTVGGATYGVAKSANLVAVRVLNCEGSGTNSGVIAGINWVTSHHQSSEPAVANMSLGGGASLAVDTAVRNSIADGVTYVVAAGNESSNACYGSPSRVADALTVGSTTSTDARSSFSNWGSCLDLFAPGSGITSAWHTSDTATNTISGTSMAAPHVAGAAVRALQATPDAGPAAIAAAIRGDATPNVVAGAGTGSPNRLLYAAPPSDVTPSPDPAPAPACATVKYEGTLSGTGAAQIQPNGNYYHAAVGGVHKGCLTGPADTDFDLYLHRWNGYSWSAVAKATGATATETVTYTGTAGYYQWRVVSYSGSGAYSFELTRPS